VNEWNAAGYEVRDREQFRYVIESVEIDPSGTVATVVVCVADGSTLVLPAAGPGSTDVIVDGTYVSGRESWDMRLGVDGVWRVYDAPALGPTESSDVCPPG
jgi:archaellum component FlaF (FlaF/FlaG flagellin family)